MFMKIPPLPEQPPYAKEIFEIVRRGRFSLKGVLDAAVGRTLEDFAHVFHPDGSLLVRINDAWFQVDLY